MSAEKTNRERADAVVNMAVDLAEGQRFNLVADVERALDDKDRFWAEKVVEAEKRGAKWLREKAAILCEDSVIPSTVDNCMECKKNPYELAEEIRSLPTEKEK